ncbi:glycoside hydrolase domain-containing protein [Curtobacterium sp. 9128]|uniref:glycoside hydrolase domain-containing protein n=1 Tax=Curtobacterium sp. 9128 TaxID=1793722 RepID=UPI0011A04D90|nr:glycoside hydrolase domain-containing protein [Curtobacterium sp. 9128]
MDLWVKNSQVWLNQRYAKVSGYNKVAEDGVTGWQTMYALTRALQHELGITALSDNFGDGTASAFRSKVGSITASTSGAGVLGILQCALWCKGYSGDTTFGKWSTVVANSVSTIRTQIGLSSSASVDVKLMRSLLTLDPYVLVTGGTDRIRAGQVWLNARYTSRSLFTIVPCDGRFTRDVQRGLMLAIQYQIGMDDATANANFGPGTQTGIRSSGTVSSNQFDSSTNHWVTLFQIALAFNGYDVALTGSFDAATSAAVAAFQSFMELPASGKGDFATWAALLVTSGDPARATSGVDTSTPLTSASAQKLIDAGYGVVLRYLTVAAKGFARGELSMLLDAGLKVVPIFENYNNQAAYFNHDIGVDQGQQAAIRARQLGIHAGAVIFFAVDYDAYDTDIDGFLKPYFEGVAEGLAISVSVRYRIGVYAARNVCTRLADAGLVDAVWVSGASTGWSGNQGYTMPKNWWYNQVAVDLTTTYTEGGVTKQLGIDHDVVSKNAVPLVRNAVDRILDRSDDELDFYWNLVRQQVLIEHVIDQVDPTVRTYANYFFFFYLESVKYTSASFKDYTPFPVPGTGNDGNQQIAFDTYMKLAGVPTGHTAGYEGDIEHVGVVLQGIVGWGTCEGNARIGPADLGGWALDVVQLWANWVKFGAGQKIDVFVTENMGQDTDKTEWSRADVISDADGWLVGRDILGTVTVPESFRTWLLGHPSWQDRLAIFLRARFASSDLSLKVSIVNNVSSVFTDPWPYTKARDAFQEGVRDPSAEERELLADAIATTWLALAKL